MRLFWNIGITAPVEKILRMALFAKVMRGIASKLGTQKGNASRSLPVRTKTVGNIFSVPTAIKLLMQLYRSIQYLLTQICIYITRLIIDVGYF